MSNRIPSITVTSFMIACSISAFCFADTIVLKDGDTIDGTILEETSDYVAIDFEGVPMKYFREDIKEIKKEIVHDNEKAAINNELAFNHFEKAKELRKKDDYSAAISELEKAIEIDPANLIYYNHIAELYYNLGQYEQSLKYCEKTLEVNSNDGRIFAFMALNYYQLGRYEKAREAFQKFQELFIPNNSRDEAFLKKVKQKVELFEQIANGEEPPSEDVKNATRQF